MYKKYRQGGFTLFELVAVIVILGIIAGIAAPQYLDVSSNADSKALTASESGTKSALAIYLAKNSQFPTVTQLAAVVPGSTAVATGIDIGDNDGNGNNEVVLTFTDDTCATATAAVGNTVLCVRGTSN